jgi:hypothetical protein
MLDEGENMNARTQEAVDKVRALPDIDKLTVVDSILLELDRPDPELDRIWADESRARWQAYRDGRAEHVSYADVMAKYRQT